MPSILRIALLSTGLGFAFSAQATAPAFTVTVDGIEANKPVPAAQALCTPTKDGKSDKLAKPLRPTIHWAGAPEGTKSFAVFMMDPDVPADFTDAGQEGKVIAKDAKRQDFFHYGVINIPATVTALNGSSADKAPKYGMQLVNDLGSYVAAPAQFGGPCPPWNDARLHHYHFMVLALDADAPVSAPAGTKDSATAKATFNRLIGSKHVLAKAAVVGTYTLNPSVKP